MLIYEDVCWSELFEGGGSKATVEPLTVTENGMYTAPDGVVYSPVNVDVNFGPDDGGDLPFEDLTWDQVIVSTQTGKYKNFEIGAMKELDLGSEGIVHMQIVGIDEDDLADGSGKAPLTFISKELLKTSHRMNATNTNTGGWEASEMRTYLRGTVKPLIPSAVATQIKEVKKYSYSYDGNIANAETTDDVWIPSRREVNITSAKETLGPVYSAVFPDNASKIKAKTGETNASWWLRSASGSGAQYFTGITASGASNYSKASTSYGAALGFCL